MKILLIRHGETVTNKSNIFTGHLNVELSETGKFQAEKLCRYLSENTQIDKVYSSDLKRAIDTIKPLLEEKNLPLITDERLRELYIGRWEGLSRSDISEKFPEEYEMWENGISTHKFGGGESITDLSNRAVDFFNGLKNETAQTVAVVTHGALIRTFMGKVLGIPIENTHRLEVVANASVSELNFSDGKFEIVRSDYVDYLDGCVTRFMKN